MTSLSAGQLSEEDRNEEIIFEKKASGKKKKTSKRTPQSSSKNPKEKSPDIQTTKSDTGAPTSRTLHIETEEGVCSTPVSTATGIPSGEVWTKMEASDSTPPPSLSSTSDTSEPPICSPSETPHSTPAKSCSAESLSTPPNLTTSESDMLTCSKEPKTPPSTPPLETADDLTLPDETGSTPTEAKSTIVIVTSATVLSLSTPPMDVLSSSKNSEEPTKVVVLETGTTNSSTESCKTPVAPSSDVISMEDDEFKSPLLISENECSSAEMIYAREESASEMKIDIDVKHGPCSEVIRTNDDEGAQCDNDDMAMKDLSDEGKQFVIIHSNDPCRRLLHNERSKKI